MQGLYPDGVALGAYREGARGHLCSNSTSSPRMRPPRPPHRGSSLSWEAPLATPPTHQVKAEHQAGPTHPKLCPPQSTAPWAGQGGQNAGVQLGRAAGSGPRQASTLWGTAPSYRGTVCLFLQLWSTNAVNDSLNSSI